MAILQRNDIINGKEKTVEFESQILGQSVTLRPLTDGEYSQVESLKKDIGQVEVGVNMDKSGRIQMDQDEVQGAAKDVKLKLDMKKQEDVTFKANCLAAAYGTSVGDNRVYPEDFKKAPAGLAAELAAEVMRISILTEPTKLAADMKYFREAEP